MHPGVGGPHFGRIHQAGIENALNAHQKSRQQSEKYSDQSISSNVKKISEKGYFAIINPTLLLPITLDIYPEIIESGIGVPLFGLIFPIVLPRGS